MVQIMELLTERGLGFAFCLNKAQVLLLAGFTFVYSAVESQRDGVLAKENQKLVTSVLGEMQKASLDLARAFSAVASCVVSCALKPDTPPVSNADQAVSPLTTSRPSTSPEMQHSSVRRTMSSVPAKVKKSPSMSNTAGNKPSMSQDFGGAGNMPGMGNANRLMSSSSMSDLNSAPRARSLQHHHMPSQQAKSATNIHRHSMSSYEPPALDFLWVESAQNMAAAGSAVQDSNGVVSSSDDWERMLAILDTHHTSHIYGDGNAGELSPGSQQEYESKGSIAQSIAQSDGYHSADFDTLRDGSEEVVQQQPRNSGNFGEGEGGLGDFLGPMMGGAAAAGAVAQQQSTLVDVGVAW
jgi:hypothetical protein